MIDKQNSVVLKFARNAKTLNLESENKKSIIENEQELTDLNRNQLRLGVSSDDSQLGKYKRTKYAEYKASLSSYKAPRGIPDLYVKGGFHEGLRIEIVGKQVIFDKSTADKTPYWWLKVYRGIFGLSKRSLVVGQKLVTANYFENIGKHLRK